MVSLICLCLPDETISDAKMQLYTLMTREIYVEMLLRDATMWFGMQLIKFLDQSDCQIFLHQNEQLILRAIGNCVFIFNTVNCKNGILEVQIIVTGA
uniref:Uncharacterized protein n=1 Tax=Kalanchoe fedtschenkoi TaxID=63787 RepID=A0A7N0RF36_KALFE